MNRTPADWCRRLDACELVVFDMDGTLLASHEFAPAAAQRAFADLVRHLKRDDPPPTLETIRSQIGKPWHSFYTALLPPDLRQYAAELHDRIAEYETAALRGGQARLFDGIETLLRELTDSGRPIAIMSNASTAYFHTVLDVFGLYRFARFVTCLGERGYYPKHVMLDDALRATNTRRACVVGDTAADYLAATWHGFPSIGMTYGYGQPTDWAKATATADCAAELLPWFVPRRFAAP